MAGGLTQHAKDYLAIKPLLDAFFSLSNSEKEAYLDKHPALREYFAKYAEERSQSAHARAYLAIKPVLDAFFNLPEDKRQAFLDKHPELQKYFDQWGSAKQHISVRESLAEHPEIAPRYNFWLRFFGLPPDERPEFIHKHAAKTGIFIYGSLSYDQRKLDEKRWHRQAMASGQTDRAYLYSLVAPLLNIYFKLPEGGAERALFLSTNPEMRMYLDRYASHPVKNKKLRPLVERYFALDPMSAARADYLDEHPELRAYFNRNPSDREQVIQDQMDAYFALPFGPKRDEYAAKHPELAHFFTQRVEEHANFSSLAAAFNDADPRMREFYDMYADIIPLDRMRLEWLRAEGKHPVEQLVRSGRLPLKPDEQTRRIDRAGTDTDI